MKKVVVKASASSRKDMKTTYDALCTLSDAVENMSDQDQDLFRSVTGIDVETLLDAKYLLYQEINS